MNYLKNSIVLLLFAGIFQNSFAQTPEIQLSRINENDYPEKIYIQYDKTSYFAGESIWFKAYLMEGFTPATKSTVLAVELLNDSGIVVDKKFIPIVKGAAVGDFSLPANLKQGSYTVSAYTRRHMNTGTKRVYYHAVNIYNPQASTQLQNITGNNNIVYFFPEGGNFIANKSNTIAFRSCDKWGNPKKVSGKIIDSKGNVIADFNSMHNGMGKFFLTPVLGEKYRAECLVDSIEKKTFPLPETTGEGIVLQVYTSGGKTIFNVNAGAITIPALIPAYIIGVQENIVAFKIPLNNANKEITGRIPIEKLPSGILQITVFNADNQPLAERLLFVNSGDYIATSSLRTDTLDFDRRKKNVFSFGIDNAAAGTYAVSVAAFNDEAENDKDNIVSRLLLTDDIKGYVYDPAYYFENNDETHARNLDLVMLTNGWRRYNWNEVLSYSNRPAYFKDPGYITFSAKALDPTTNEPIKNRTLSVFIKTKDDFTDMLALNTDSSGLFVMPGMIFEDTLKASFMNATAKRAKMPLKVSSQPLEKLYFIPKPDVPWLSFKPFNEKITNGNNAGIIRRNYTSSGIMMKEITLKTKTKSEKQKFEEKYTTGRLSGMANTEIDFLEHPEVSSTSILEYLKSRLPGVSISGGPMDYSINYRQTRSLSGGPIPMAVFLDEYQVEPIDLASVRVSDVALVRVISSALTSVGGALAIYTKRDKIVGYAGPEKTEVLITGFSPSREFFSPNYEDSKSGNIASDERITLYWNPYLTTTPQNSVVRFSFFNSDNAKQFKVIVEGVLEDGRLLHIEKILR
jgi:hypothetical protein